MKRVIKPRTIMVGMWKMEYSNSDTMRQLERIRDWINKAILYKQASVHTAKEQRHDQAD